MQSIGRRHRAFGARLEVGSIVDFVVDDDEHVDLLFAFAGGGDGASRLASNVKEGPDSEQLADL
jgi:hypothetical protein